MRTGLILHAVFKVWALLLVFFASSCYLHSEQAPECPEPVIIEGTDACVEAEAAYPEPFQRELFSPPSSAGWWRKATGCFLVVDGVPTIYFQDGEQRPSRVETILDHERQHWAAWCDTGSPDYGHEDRELWQ